MSVGTRQLPFRLLAVLMGLVLFAAACGGGDDDTEADGGDDTEATEETADTGAEDEADDTEDSGDDEADDSEAAGGELAPGPGFDGTTINVGVMSALSGPAAVIGTQLASGQQVYWDAINAEEGGVAGMYPVEIMLEDHLYDTATTVQQYQKIKDDVVMFSQVMGTPSVFALQDLLVEDNVVVSPASQDAFWVRVQHLMPVIEPYQIDVINAVYYYLNDGGGSAEDTICAIVQNDVYGEAGLEGLEYSAEAYGFELAAVTRYAAGDQEFTAQVTELVNAECDMVFATALPTEFGGILGTAAQSGFAPRWIAQSPAWVDELAATPLADYLQAYVWITALGREWGDPESADMTTMVERVAKYKPDQEPDYYFTFGYLQAWAVHQVLEAAVANGDLSRAGIITAMNGLSELNYGDLGPSYGYGPPEARNPARASTIFAVDVNKPFALAALASNVESPEAQAFEFPAGG